MENLDDFVEEYEDIDTYSGDPVTENDELDGGFSDIDLELARLYAEEEVNNSENLSPIEKTTEIKSQSGRNAPVKKVAIKERVGLGGQKSSTKLQDEKTKQSEPQKKDDSILRKLYGQSQKGIRKELEEPKLTYTIPQELKDYINEDKQIKAFWETLHTGQKKAFCDYINEHACLAKTRISQVYIMLKNRQTERLSKAFKREIK